MNYIDYRSNENSTFFELEVQDFAYHIIIIKNFWFNDFGDIYKLEFQKKSLSKHIKTRIDYVMPLGITPIALLIWFPFAYISNYSIALSYTLWIACSLLILYSSLWYIIIDLFKEKKPPFLLSILFILTLFSPAFLGALFLGQTSIFASGMIIHLLRFLRKKNKTTRWIPYLILFSLGIKPVYSIIAFGILIIYQKWREAFVSVIIIIFYLILITPLITIEWVGSYINLLQMYSSGRFPKSYAWSIVPHTMNIFRSAFTNVIGDIYSNLISSLITIVTYFFVITYSIINLKNNTKGRNFFKSISNEQALLILIGGYLLFAPYANAYEDFLVLPVLVILALSGIVPKLSIFQSTLFAIAFFIILSQSCLNTKNFLWFLWIVKAAIFLLIYFFFCFEESKIKEPITNPSINS